MGDIIHQIFSHVSYFRLNFNSVVMNTKFSATRKCDFGNHLVKITYIFLNFRLVKSRIGSTIIENYHCNIDRIYEVNDKSIEIGRPSITDR